MIYPETLTMFCGSQVGKHWSRTLPATKRNLRTPKHIIIIIIISNLLDDRSKASSKMIPPLNAI